MILGAAALIGIIWIAFAKWRENKRRRNQFSGAEAKRGFCVSGADDPYPSSQDSLLAVAAAGEGKQSESDKRAQNASTVPFVASSQLRDFILR